MSLVQRVLLEALSTNAKDKRSLLLQEVLLWEREWKTSTSSRSSFWVKRQKGSRDSIQVLMFSRSSIKSKKSKVSCLRVLWWNRLLRPILICKNCSELRECHHYALTYMTQWCISMVSRQLERKSSFKCLVPQLRWRKIVSEYRCL